MTCFACGKDKPTIDGSCADCRPDLHEAFAKGQKRYAQLAEKFEAETGRRAIENWTEFEAWKKGK